jgi:phosphatidylinositol-3-phosphatase
LKTGSNRFAHVFLVAEENHGFNSVIGDTNMPFCCSGALSLEAQFGLAVNFFADTHPSIGNYFMLTDGVAETNDDSQTPSSFQVSNPNLFRSLISASVTWKVYAEDLPNVGYTGGDTANYAVRHNPAVYYTDVQNTPQKSNVVPFADPAFGLAADVANHSLPTFAMIVPNVQDDEHDGTDVQADLWLQTDIQPLLSSPDFANSVLLLWWDEGDDNGCTLPDNGSSCGGQVAFVVVGSRVKPGYQGTKYYQHGAAERFIYDALGLGTAPGAGATANDMSDFFDPPSAAPTPTATPGG